MPRIVISLTTTPARLPLLQEMLGSLIAQTAPCDAVLVHIPHHLRRTGQSYVIPDWLQTMRGVEVHRCADFGPATKLLGALECEADPETLIITVDDDVRYPPAMVEAYLQNAACSFALCTAGFNIADRSAFARDVRGAIQAVRGHLARAHVAEGYGSVAYRRSFFSNDVFDVLHLPECVLYSDDLYISNYLGLRGIDRMTIETEAFGGPESWVGRVFPYGEHPDALHHNRKIGTNRARYSQAVRYFIENGRYGLEPTVIMTVPPAED